jgi:hypothetical protein
MKNSFLSRMRKPFLLQRAWEKFLSYFLLRQWILLVAKGANNESPAWEHFTPLLPPSDRIWADPFLWNHEGRYFIFYEEKLHTLDHGHIACLALDNHMKPIANCIALERPYHLSYPFVFEYQEQLYMLPETKKNRTVELYRCEHFPDQWVFAKTLLSDISAADTTLLEAYGKWWLFTVEEDSLSLEEEVSNSRDLTLYYADYPLSTHWISHPHNPIVRDIHSARPAGKIFFRDGDLIRPSQDCSVRYGYAINFNRITTLTESDYRESCEWTFKPQWTKNILGVHTWNELAGLRVIDALFYRQRP